MEFAMFQPWTFEHNIDWTFQLMRKVTRRRDLYFHVETIGLTHYGLPLQAFHISGLQGLTNLTFSNTEGLFPNQEEERALKYPLKKYIVILGRI